MPDKPFTHTALGNPPDSWPGSYCIEENDSETFFKLYKKQVFTNKFKTHLTEKHRDISPILIDLDLRHALEEGNNVRKYGLDFIKQFVGLYLEEVKKIIQLPEDQTYRYDAFVMEKKKPVVQTKGKPTLKDGIHIVFPYLATEPKLQYIFRYNTITNPDIASLFQTIKVTNSLEDIFDIAVIERNNWQMYGSCKPDCEAYKMTYILDSECQHKDISQFTEMEFVKTLSIRHINDEDIVHISEDKIEYINQEHLKIPKQQQQKKPKRIMNKKKKSPVKKNIIDDEDLLFVRKIVKILKVHRSESYDSWLRMGWCLHNIDYRLLENWVEFSKKSEKFVEGECEKEWCDMDNDGLGMGSLFMWAREDNVAKFNELSKDNLRKCMSDSLSVAPNDIAKVVYHMYKHDFVCINAKKNLWYQFQKHRWVEIDDSVDLKKKFSTEVVNEYMRYRSYLTTKAYDVNNGGTSQEQKIVEDKIAIIGRIILKLKETSFKKNVNSECIEMFHDSKFEEKLDTQLNLIGFENGIYDLDLLEFRDGLPEDYVSFSTGINYEEFDEDDEQLEDVIKFTEQVLPKPHIREYVLTLMSSFLSGKTHNEKFHIWSGCHAKGTGIMKHDGHIEKVENINEGDYLMGPNSEPRCVKKLIRGNSQMYEISPSKGESFVVNEDHILALKATKIGSIIKNKKENRVKLAWQERDENGYPINKCQNFPYKSENKTIYRKSVVYYDDEVSALREAKKYQESLMNERNVIKNGDVIEIPLKEYLNRVNLIGSRNYYLYKVPIEFESKEVDIEPYILGYWLGDGNSNNFGITTMDSEIEEYFDHYIQKENLDKKIYTKLNNKAKTINYSSFQKKNNSNHILNYLKNYNLIKNKHIPDDYKINSRENRLQILAGLIDSDGHYNSNCNQYEITLKSEKLIDDVLYLVRSLGFSGTKKLRQKKCYNTGKIGTYYQIIFYGENIPEIPVKLERKQSRERLIKKNALRYSFKVNKLEHDDYYGFQLDHDHLYLTEDFMVHHNCGGNGKSKLVEVFENGFRDYCCKLPVTLLTQQRARAEAATPALVRTKGKRFACLQEPDKNEEIQVGLMKELTGGDKIIARGLYGASVEFKPQFKLVMTCNDKPSISGNDKGVWRRVSVVEFIAEFLDDPDPNEPYQFKIDEDLNEKLQEWPEAFIYLLLSKYFPLYRKNGLKEPSEIKKNTENYHVETDMYIQFFNEKLVELENCNGKGLKIDDIYFVYGEWYKLAKGQGAKVPPRKDLQSNMTKRYGSKIVGAGQTVYVGLGFKDIVEIVEQD